jgi:hypothetical protein
LQAFEALHPEILQSPNQLRSGKSTRDQPLKPCSRATINILCDTALVYGFASSVRVITEEIVASVIDNKNRYGVLPISKPAT